MTVVDRLNELLEAERAPRERVAQDFVEGLAAARPSVDDAIIARLRAVTDAEIVELGFAAGGFLMWGRLHRAFDVPASGPGYHAMLANESGGMPDPGSLSH